MDIILPTFKIRKLVFRESQQPAQLINSRGGS